MSMPGLDDARVHEGMTQLSKAGRKESVGYADQLTKEPTFIDVGGQFFKNNSGYHLLYIRAHCLNYRLYFKISKFRIYWQREHIKSGLLCVWKVVTSLQAAHIGRLQVYRYRIVNQSANFIGFQI
jgi:hypothetical protein